LNNPQGFRLQQDDTLFLESKETPNCISLKITDLQANTSIKFRLAIASGPQNVGDSSQYFININGDSASASFCLPACAFTTAGQPWKIRLTAEDNGCPEPFVDTLNIFLQIPKIPLQAPIIQAENMLPDTIRLNQRQNLQIPLLAKQLQQFPMVLSSRIILPSGQVLTGWEGITLPGGGGIGEIRRNISFSGICTIPGDGRIRVEVVVASSRCQETLRDTVSQWFYILPERPQLIISSSWTGPDSIVLNEREKVEFAVNAQISDGSLVSLLSSGTLTTQKPFQLSGPSSGLGSIERNFSYFASCDAEGGVFQLKLKASGNICNQKLTDSLTYKFAVNYQGAEIGDPPNLIILNGDPGNQYFSLEGIISQKNCATEFDYVEIYNRWGKRVFYEKRSDFKWLPSNLSEGLYFYSLHFVRKDSINGWLQVVGSNK